MIIASAMKYILFTFILVGTAVFIESAKVRYDNYKLYRFIPKTHEEREILLNLEDHSPAIIFWKDVGQIGQPSDILFPPHLIDMAESLKSQGIASVEVIKNVQKLLDDEEATLLLGKTSKGLNWDNYYDLDTIHKFLSDQHALHPNRTTLMSAGKSHEGRDLTVLKISSDKNAGKPAIWIDANIHAREWITNTVATKLIDCLLNNEEKDPDMEWLLKDFDWYIIPVMNPDGYYYSMTTDRMWRKTRSPVPGNCNGVDPNRNWGHHWNEGGASKNPCAETYRGAEAFSEVETKSISEFYKKFSEKVVMYLSLHCYSQLILLAYSYTSTPTPEYALEMEIATETAKAIKDVHGTQFTAGNVVDLLYVASGSSQDWVKGNYNKTLTYTFELRDTGDYGFILPANQIGPSSKEFNAGLKVLANRVKSLKKGGNI